MKEVWLKCQECNTRASGIWLLSLNGERKAFVRLCAQCGLHDYIHKRETFSPGLKLDLVCTFRTGFRQCDQPHDTVPVKSWVEHTAVPDKRLPNGMTILEVIKQNAIKRHGPSSVHDSLKRR